MGTTTTTLPPGRTTTTTLPPGGTTTTTLPPGGTTTTTLPPGGTTTTTLPPGSTTTPAGTTTTTTITTTAKPIVKCSELANPYSSATCCREDVCCVGRTCCPAGKACCASNAGRLVVVGTHCCLGDGCCALRGQKDCCNDDESCCATGCFEHCKMIKDSGEEGFKDNLRQSRTKHSDCGCRKGVSKSKCQMLNEEDPSCLKHKEVICPSGGGSDGSEETCTLGKCTFAHCPTNAPNRFARRYLTPIREALIIRSVTTMMTTRITTMTKTNSMMAKHSFRSDVL